MGNIASFVYRESLQYVKSFDWLKYVGHGKTCRRVKMAFGLYSLLEAILLVLNAICVLHEQRFLSKSKKIIFQMLHRVKLHSE